MIDIHISWWAAIIDVSIYNIVLMIIVLFVTEWRYP